MVQSTVTNLSWIFHLSSNKCLSFWWRNNQLNHILIIFQLLCYYSQPRFPCISYSWKPDSEFLQLGLIVWHPPTQRGEMSGWGSSGWRFGAAIFCASMGGFPRTWYSGNHCCGRASQLGSGCHILATSIPEAHHHLIFSDSMATPLCPYYPHSASDRDPNWGSVCFGVVLSHILAICKRLLGRFIKVMYRVIARCLCA